MQMAERGSRLSGNERGKCPRHGWMAVVLASLIFPSAPGCTVHESTSEDFCKAHHQVLPLRRMSNIERHSRGLNLSIVSLDAHEGRSNHCQLGSQPATPLQQVQVHCGGRSAESV